ncbi:LpxL/LpxP family Kdo(2)-lipid IV(A) lauroyl/palmitoleoyl acyltransferase [Thiothrix lacustris]|uniref:Lipid A biosynthesis acyltransferase n=1 Tax=Thiothrix lacustris TaxID=525917 RepID=A0ABY9MT19_9GAMM|nr:LpxL/LpxP family Kdo(2)-lipid IV(A) lauroyl/palmitoleoyl acyltransferase [Thiothrix lacustris]WML91793.1 LpxL/LpxP family Kdo(2)-lipid IV(A) lauroyl/palmitoleoyl acyltransferase [Thiothrix lacustris]
MSTQKTSGKHFLHPRYWLTWFGLGFLWLLVQLPWSVQMWLGKQFGLLMFYLLPKRREICCINLELAFPERTAAERTQLNREHFISLGRGLLETALSWWGDDDKLAQQTDIEGLENLQAAMQQGGVVLLSAHFTSLELGGRLIAQRIPLHVIYRPHQNPLIEWRVARLRSKRYGKAISRDNIRDMLRSLQQGHVVWYAQDQNFGHKNAVFAPFFGVEAATNTATSRLSKLGKAQVVPFFTLRTATGYQLRFLPALENFPSEAILDDTTRINNLIEQQVREFPAQYLWTHRRFKDDPSGGNRYILYSKENQCKSHKIP